MAQYEDEYSYGYDGYKGADSADLEKAGREPISSDMIVRDIILAHPDAAEVLMRIGMGCISCPAALMESIGDACMVHGLDGEEVVKYLNQELNLPQAETNTANA